MTLRLRRMWLFSTVTLAGLAFVAFGVTARAATPQKEEKASKEAQAKKDGQESAELEKIEAKLRGLEQEIKELRAAGKDDAAEKLAREGRELKAALQKPDSGKGKKDSEGVRDAEVQLKRLAAEMEEHKAAGKLDAAEKLERQIRELKEKLAKREGDAKKPDDKKPVDKKPEPKKSTGESAELAAKIDAMQHEAAKLREAGRTEEAEKILRQVAELKEHWEKGLSKGEKKPESGDKGKKSDNSMDELRDKLKKLEAENAELRKAAAQLKLAIDEANARRAEATLLREQLKTTQELKDNAAKRQFEREQEYIERKGKGETGDKGEKSGAAAASPELAAAVKELREQVSRLREEVADLRRIVKSDKPASEKGKKEEREKKEEKEEKGEKKGGEKKDPDKGK